MKKTREDACQLQADRNRGGDILIWTICEHPLDFPDEFTARPHSVFSGWLEFVLVADTLDRVRALLPPGLVRLQREPADAPVIVESWA